VSFKIYGILALAISFFINYKLHIGWTKDQLTGFIDTKLNNLSPAGWYHMIFASLEMTVMLLLIWIFVIIVLEKNHKGLNIVKRLFWIFFLYSSLAILDLLIKEKYVVNEPDLLKAILNNFLDLKVFFAGVFFLLTYYGIRIIFSNNLCLK
jgi:hypothetical protein